MAASTFLTKSGSSDHRRPIRVTVRGHVDASTSPRLAARLQRAVELPVGRIQLDLSAVDFIDSHGIEVLRAARDLAEARAIVLVIEPPPPTVRRQLAARGVDDFEG